MNYKRYLLSAVLMFLFWSTGVIALTLDEARSQGW